MNEYDEHFADLYAEDEGAEAARRHNEWEAYWSALENGEAAKPPA